jgi:hypothetical protein
MSTAMIPSDIRFHLFIFVSVKAVIVLDCLLAKSCEQAVLFY